MTPKMTIFFSVVMLLPVTVFGQRVSIPNPIIFVSQVPIPVDSNTLTASFSNHVPDMGSAGRGSDLYIYYPDGTLKNLTKSAGYGVDGFQGAGSIAIRQPSIHWSGTKALFSMVIGAAVTQGQKLQYYWQIYEITGIGENETPVITKVPNQPATYNNLSPIYGTDERIIFTSDRPREGKAYLYPLLDEHFAFFSTTGLWSLDPVSGDLFQMNISPSGAFNPFIDSYGRVVFTRWDHLQRDPLADRDAMGIGHYGTFNYSDESAAATATSSRDEIFPEPEPFRNDLLQGTNIIGQTFNQFFPWQINEDGTSEETLNHIGRHELLPFFSASINDDTNVYDFNFATSGRLNDSTLLQNILQLAEDPLNPEIYYGVNILDFDVHSAAQIVSLNANPSLDPGAMAFTYLTDRATLTATPEGTPTDPNNSGHYRNPLPLTNGKLLVVHTAEPRVDKNKGTRSHPLSRYDFRIKTMKESNHMWTADSLITPGISKTVSYWDPDTLVSYSGPFWELDPVEVTPRQKPVRRASTLAVPELQVFSEEGVNEAAFREDMKRHDLAMIVSRNVTHRDKSDHQQPYFLKVHNSATQSANPHGKIYDVAHAELYQADYIRGMTYGNPAPVPGRRVLAQLMHDSAVHDNPSLAGEKPYTTKIFPDGSFAAFVPPQRAIVWALTDSNSTTIVRERYWITTQPGEIRVCASCHGTNDEALIHADPPPQNEPEALRSLLKYWKSSHTPLSPELVSPPNDSVAPMTVLLTWNKIQGAVTYQVTTSATQDFANILFASAQLSDTSLLYSTGKNSTAFFWRVQASGDTSAAYSGVWKFTTEGISAVPTDENRAGISIMNHPNPFSMTTTIDFTLRNSEAVKITIFNVLGQEITTLANGFYDAGKHSLFWDAKNLPGGTYYYRMTGNEGIHTGSMSIIR